MTAIDMTERCEMLGISLVAYQSASDKILDAVAKSQDGAFFPFEQFGKVLDPEELRAIIAWDRLDRRFPDIFTSEGMQPQYR